MSETLRKSAGASPRRRSTQRRVLERLGVGRLGVGLASVAALALACASSDETGAGPSSGSTSSSGAGGGDPGGVTLEFPQLVRGAGYVDFAMFDAIPVRVRVVGAAPERVEVTLDDQTVEATPGATAWVAKVPVAFLSEGAHPLVARAYRGPTEVGKATGSVVAGKGSRQLTSFSADGLAYAGDLARDLAKDQLLSTWIGTRGGSHRYYLRPLDGALRPLAEQDVVLTPEGEEPLGGATALGPKGLGVVYRTAKPDAAQWLVKLRVVDRDGKELVAPQDLTQGETAFSQVAAGADPGGFSAAWLHIRPLLDGKPQPVEVRFARYDMAKQALAAPLVLDASQPAPMGSMGGEQRLEPLAELQIACNTNVCLVSYSRQVYDAFVALNVPKLFVARVDLETGKAEPATPVALQPWDSQLFGQHLVALADGSFALVFTSNDTVAAVKPKSPCDTTLQRDLLRMVRFDATGKQLGKPQTVLDHEGTRQYPRLAPRADGTFGMLWEDQRSYCVDDPGHIRMATSTLDAAGTVGAYHELPGSIGLPPEDPAIVAVDANAVMTWSDNRHGDGLLDAKLELYGDTLWSE